MISAMVESCPSDCRGGGDRWASGQLAGIPDPQVVVQDVYFGFCLYFSLPCAPVVLDPSLYPEYSTTFQDVYLCTYFFIQCLFLCFAQHTVSAHLLKYQLKKKKKKKIKYQLKCCFLSFLIQKVSCFFLCPQNSSYNLI